MLTEISHATGLRRQQFIRRAWALSVLGSLLICPIGSLAAPRKGEPERGALLVGRSGDNAGTVFDVRIEPAGLRCPTGGQFLLGGIDQNLNRALDPVEVQDKVFFCNGVGPSGQAAGFRSRQEPANITCPKGGTRYSWGYDDDGNRQLDDDEELFYVGVCRATR